MSFTTLYSIFHSNKEKIVDDYLSSLNKQHLVSLSLLYSAPSQESHQIVESGKFYIDTHEILLDPEQIDLILSISKFLVCAIKYF